MEPRMAEGGTSHGADKAPVRARWVPFYTGAVALVGALVFAVALAEPPKDHVGLLIFLLFAVGAEMFSVELFRGTRGSRVSVSAIIATASILSFGPLAGALTHMVSGITAPLVSALTSRGQEGQKRASLFQRVAFNAGMLVVATAVAGWVYILTGGVIGKTASARNVLPLILSVGADQLANIAILIGVLTLQTGERPLQIWRKNFAWGMPITVIGGVVGGGALAMAYQMFGVFGVLVFLLPVAAIGYSFRLYIANTRVYVNQLEELNKDLDDANVGLLETLGAVIDADDMYTYGHSAQVAIYAEALAERLGVSKSEQILIVKAALVHDVGKVGIKDTIIGKQGRLTDEEYKVVKRHPVIGAEIVGRMKGLQELVPLVRHHHERWDGRGYPDGVGGEEIPMGSRILALADTVDAMYSDRPYRMTRNLKEVIDEVVRCSGTQFDPKVVEGFLELVQDKPAGFFKNSAVTVDTVLVMSGMPSIGSGRYMKRGTMTTETTAVQMGDTG